MLDFLNRLEGGEKALYCISHTPGRKLVALSNRVIEKSLRKLNETRNRKLSTFRLIVGSCCHPRSEGQWEEAGTRPQRFLGEECIYCHVAEGAMGIKPQPPSTSTL